MGKSAVLSVKIISDPKGAVEGFKTTSDEAEGLGAKLKSISPGALAIGGAIATGAIAVGKELYNLGARFDEVKDTIRVGTGATGDALQGLVDTAHNVATTIPVDFEKAGTAVADVNTRLGLTGPTLEKVASQYLEAGRILGTEIDIAGTSAAFSAFGIQGEAVSGALDELFQVSQATGVGMNELAGGAQKNAEAMQALGFGFEDTVRLIGTLDKAGVDSNATLASMQRGLTGLVSEGESAQDAFKRVTAEITGYINAGDEAAALNQAKDIFGAEAASQMIGAIKSGALSMDDLTSATGQTSDSILDVARDTMSASEKWEILKNKGLEALEPLASGVFDFASDALGAILDWVENADFSAITGMFESFAPAIDAVGNAFSTFDTTSMQGAFGSLQPIFDSLGTALADALPKILEVAQAIQGALGPVFEALAPIVMGAIGTIIDVLNGVLTVIQGVVMVIQGIFTGDWQMIWDGVKMIVEGAINAVVALVTGLYDMFKAQMDMIGNTLKNLWQSAWDAVTGYLSSAVSSIGSTVAGIPGRIMGALGNLGSLLYNAGSQVIQGFINGILAKAGSLASSILSTVKGGVQGVLQYLGIQSPSRLFRKIGAHTGEGLILGINDQANAVADAWADMMTVPEAPRVHVPAPSLNGAPAPSGGGNTYQITINGVLDGADAARKIREVLTQYDRITGTVRMGALA